MNRRGYFWGDRFKSVIVDKGVTLVNCLAYIDLNPLRAGSVKHPEEYRWSSIGYHSSILFLSPPKKYQAKQATTYWLFWWWKQFITISTIGKSK